MSANPFDLNDDQVYARWRDWKLASMAKRVEDLAVEVQNPLAPTEAEVMAIHERVARTNMALYVGPAAVDGKDALAEMAFRLGLKDIDANLCADDDGITPLTVDRSGDRPRYIPYTNRGIRWHTDGYYNSDDNQVRGLVLHCQAQAEHGGANQLMDHELVYIRLRDRSPDLIAALMRPDAYTIPPNETGGVEIRSSVSGAVFEVRPENGALHMRYTMRKRNIDWNPAPEVTAAVAAINEILEDPGQPGLYRHLLAPGQGLICNNVLHDREAFDDRAEARRLIYRGRFVNRVVATAPADLAHHWA